MGTCRSIWSPNGVRSTFGFVDTIVCRGGVSKRIAARHTTQHGPDDRSSGEQHKQTNKLYGTDYSPYPLPCGVLNPCILVAQGHAVVPCANRFTGRRDDSSMSSIRRQDRLLLTGDVTGGRCSLCALRAQPLLSARQRDPFVLVRAADAGPQTVRSDTGLHSVTLLTAAHAQDVHSDVSRLSYAYSMLHDTVHNVWQVVVSGAAGRTGSLIMQKLRAQPHSYRARGIVRNEEVPSFTTPVLILAYICP